MVVDKTIVPAEDADPRPRRGTRAASFAADPPPEGQVLPGGRAMVATARAFGAKAAPVTIAETDDGLVNSVFDIREEGFQFSMLFSRFSPPGLDMFVLDKTQVILKRHDRTSRIIVGGLLRMDSSILRPFRRLVGSDPRLLIGGQVKLAPGEAVTGKIEPREFHFSSAAPFHVELQEGVVFTDLELNVDITPGPAGRGWRIVPSMSGKLQLSHLADGVTELDCKIRYEDGTLQVSAGVKKIDLRRLGQISIDDLTAEFQIGRENLIKMGGTLKPAGKKFHLAGALTSEYVGLRAEASSFTLKDVGDLYEQLTTMHLELPDFRVKFRDIKLGLATAPCKIDGTELSRGISFSGTVEAHGHTFTASARIMPEGVTVTGTSSDIVLGPITIKKPRLEMQVFSKSSGKATGFAISGSVQVDRLTVDAKLIYRRVGKSGWNAIVYAAMDTNEFTLSKLIPGIQEGTLVDDLGFKKVAIIYASKPAEIEDADFKFQAKKGLQLVGELKEIPQITQLVGGESGSKGRGLMLSAQLGSRAAIGVAMPESTRLHLGDSVSCDPFKMEIVVLPSPQLDLIFGMKVAVPKQEERLQFDLKLAVGATDASGSGTMKNYWVDPFGLSGLKIGPELALELGIEYQVFSVSGIPSKFGLVGGLAMGDVVARMAVGVATNPMDMILYGELEKLEPSNLIAFANEVADAGIPEDAVPDFIQLNQLKLYAAPAGGTIGTVVFEPGFSFNCDLVFFGKKANCFFRIGDGGLVAKGHLDKIELGPLTIGGRRGENLLFDLALTAERQGVRFDGEIDFLGSSIGLFADVSTKGVEFEFEQSFLGLLTYTINGKSEGSLLKPRSLDFRLTAEFDNKLTEYLQTTVSNKIGDAIKAVAAGIDEAKAEVERTQRLYEREFDKANAELTKAQADADRYLDQVVNALQREKADYSRKIENARAKVRDAKAKFDGALRSAQVAVTKAQRDYNQGIRKAQADVDRAERTYNAELNKAQAAVNRAERAYNAQIARANATLVAARNNVNSLRSHVNSAHRTLGNLRWWEAYKRPYYWAKIAGLEIAIAAANAGLSVAQFAVNDIGGSAGKIAFDAARRTLDAVRWGGHYVAFNTARGALEAVRWSGQQAMELAKRTLDAVRSGAEFTVWQGAQTALNVAEGAGRLALTAAEEAVNTVGRSVAYLALEAAKGVVEAVKVGSAAVAFEGAKIVLEGAKAGATAVLAAAQWIAENATKILDIKHVKLSASLKDIQRGKFFDAELDVVLFGTEYHWAFSFDVTRIDEFIEEIFVSAFGVAKKLEAPA